MSDEVDLRWSRRLIGEALGVSTLLLAMGALLGYLVAHEPPPSSNTASSASSSPPAVPAPRQASSVELAFIAPIAPGARVLDYTVTRVLPVENGVLSIELDRGKSAVRLDIAKLQPGGPSAPATFGEFGVFYAQHGAGREDGARLATAIAKLLADVDERPAPPGLSVLQQRQTPL